MLIQLTRNEAEAWGLLACGTCGHPRNNHFEFSDGRPCAHCTCKQYVERSRVGTIMKIRPGVPRTPAPIIAANPARRANQRSKRA